MKQWLILILLFISCQNENTEFSDKDRTTNNSFLKKQNDQHNSTTKSISTFEYDEVYQPISQKIKRKDTLFIHILVPLCDNEHQGIVKVNKTLGDGFNPKGNLYWGAMYGIKNYFLKYQNWKIISSNKISESIIERIVLFKKMTNGIPVIVIADAYRGDKMKTCLTDFFNSFDINSNDNQLVYNEKTINADLYILNGHNGLMDVEIDPISNKGKTKSIAAVIGCFTDDYFQKYLKSAQAYPLITTTNFMAPEAYVSHALIESFALGKKQEVIIDDVAKLYNTYQKCGFKGARRLFKSGWKD